MGVALHSPWERKGDHAPLDKLYPLMTGRPPFPMVLYSVSRENGLLIGQQPARSDQTKLDPHFIEGPVKASSF